MPQLRQADVPGVHARRGRGVVLRAVPGIESGHSAARRSDEWTIDAATRVPHRMTYTWRTTGEYRGNVLAQVEAGIAYGEIPRPRHATFVGVKG